MEINNFDILMAHMDFVLPTDRYIVHILRRPKDCKALANTLGSNEAQRKIRSYCIDSLDYLKRKIPAIKELCQSCNARAYLVVQPKDNFECLANLGKKIFETFQMKNYSVKPEHLLWTAYGETHNSRRKQWILDLDNDSMTEYLYIAHNDFPTGKRVWTVDEVLKLVKEMLVECGKDPELAYVVPTKNGTHIITPPFNLKAAQAKCGMLYEGVKTVPTAIKYTAPYVEEVTHEKITGWLHKDGMTLLFCCS